MAVSSLLKSAAAARKRTRQLEDRYVDFDWDMSAKTPDDLERYLRHYRDREQRAVDPGDQLTYTKKQYTAQRRFRSAEIMRMSTAVNEGRATLYEKQDRMFDLYAMAEANGDANLAQSIRAQIGSLDIQIQNMEQSAQRAAGTMALNRAKSVKELQKKFLDGDEPIQLPDGTQLNTLRMLAKEVETFGQDADIRLWDEMVAVIEEFDGFIQDAADGATTMEAYEEIQDATADFLSGTQNVDVLGENITINDIMLARDSAAAGNPMFGTSVSRDATTGDPIYNMEKRDVTGQQWIRTRDGNYDIIDVRRQEATGPELDDRPELNDRFVLIKSGKDAGKYIRISNVNVRDGETTEEANVLGGTATVPAGTQTVTMEEIIKAGGYKIVGERDGFLRVQGPDSRNVVDATTSSDANGPGLRFYEVSGTYVGADGLPTMGIYQTNFSMKDGNITSSTAREINPEEDVSIFGDELSPPTEQGSEFIRQLAGTARRKDAQRRLDRSMTIGQATEREDFDRAFGEGSMAVTSDLLQGAEGTRGRIREVEAERQRKAQEAAQALREQLQQQALQAGPALQQANAPNLNQMQARGANTELLVERARPQRISRVENARPSGSISNVDVGRPTNRIGGTGMINRSTTIGQAAGRSFGGGSRAVTSDILQGQSAGNTASQLLRVR